MSANCYVIAGPEDDEDGTLYWSNEDGWGHLETATVFSEEEYCDGNGSLPVGDNAHWVEHPRVIELQREIEDSYRHGWTPERQLCELASIQEQLPEEE